MLHDEAVDPDLMFILSDLLSFSEDPVTAKDAKTAERSSNILYVLGGEILGH